MSAPLPSRHARRRRAAIADINVTPMVDVMLVLLIIFMVTAPLLTAGVEIDLPQASARTVAQDDRPVVIAIDADGAVFVGDRRVEAEALDPALAALDAKAAIQLRADRSLPYGRVMRVMAALQARGLTRVALITTDAPEGP